MFRELISVLPFGWLITLSVFGFVFISYVAARFSAHYLSLSVDQEHRELVNTLISIVSGALSILLAFVIINTWNYLMTASDVTNKEADNLATIIRNVMVFPEESRKNIVTAVGNYTRAVRLDEWQAMRNGYESPKAWTALNDIFINIQAVNPGSQKVSLFYSQVISDLNTLLQTRRERLNKVNSVIPGQLRDSLIFATIFLAIILGVIRGERGFKNLAPILLFSGSLGFNLGLALAFDYPFSGDISVSNAIFYKGVLGQFPDR